MGLLANVPTLSYIQWKNLLITYNNITYRIENSHTNKPFIYWDVNNPYLLTTSNIKLEERTGLFYIIFNESGVYTVVPNDDIKINFSENPSRDAITEKIIGLSNNTKDQFVAIQVDMEGIKTSVAKCEEDLTKNTSKISTIEQRTDEIGLEVQSIERQYDTDKEKQSLRDNFLNAILDLQSVLGLFSSDMNTYMEDNRLTDEEENSIEAYKENLNEKRNNLNTQLDIIIEEVSENDELEENELILLNSAKEDLNASIDNLLTNIDTVCVDNVFTNTEITAVVNYFGKANMEINECKNLIDEYFVLGIGGVLIEEVSRINLKQDQINFQVKSSYYSKEEVDEKIENVDIGLVVRNVEVMYYLSTSSSSLEGGEWKNSVPTIERDKFIWSKTVTIYSDESTSETEPICITNNNNYTWIKYSDSPDGTDMYDIPTDDTLYIGIATNRETDIESNNSLDYVWSKFRGVDGNSYYTWIRYADDKDGNGISDDPTGKLYIGFAYNKSSNIESNNPSDYMWSLIKGTDGVDGTSIKILGTYNSESELNTAHPSDNEIGDSYIVQGDLYVWTGTIFENVGQIRGEDGKDGVDGVTLYTWIKYSDNEDGSNMYDTPTDNTKYIGIATNKITQTESDIVSDYKWSKFRGDDGVDGDTYYTWIKYADDENGKNMSNDPTDKLYIGLAYNKATSTESNVASDYKWSLIKGTDGVNGENGKDGTTYYTWIKYSDNEDGSNMYDVPTDNTKYIGIAVNKTTLTETDVASDYKWSKFKGDDGVDGTDGKGIVGIVDYYKVHTLDTGITNESEGFSTNIPQMDEVNKYLWAYEIITYTDDSITKTLARVIGVFGADGKGIEEIIEYYAVNGSNSIAPTNFDTIVPLFDDENIYLWNYEEIFYTDGTSIESSKRVIGTKGEKGDTGKGIKNIVSEFYLSTSKDNQIDGEWVETPPQWQTGTYIWTRSKIIYEDDTFEYSTPVCDTTWENISDLQDQVDKNKEQIETTIERVSDIDISLEGITSKVTKTEQTVANINGQVTSIESRMTSAEEKITDEAIINTVSSVYSTKTETSAVQQTANKINWIIKSGTSSSNMQLTSNALNIIADNINMDGYVTFTNLSTSGQTTINGANIKSGTIRGVEIISSLTDTTNRVKMVEDGHFYYSSTKQAGEIHYDSNGAGTTQSAKDRFLISSNNGYVLKLKSSGNMSLEANSIIYIMSEAQFGNSANFQSSLSVTGNANLNGTVTGKNATWEIITSGYGRFDGGLGTSTLSCSSTSTFSGSMTVNAGAVFNSMVTGKNSTWAIGTTGYGRFDGGVGTSSLSCSSTSSFSGKATFNGYLQANQQANLYGYVDGANQTWGITTTGYARFNLGTGTGSDIRFKTDIKRVNVDTQTIGEDGLMSPNVKITTQDMHEFIETLPLVSYRMIEEKKSGVDNTHYGFIAQEILETKVGSELLSYTEDGYLIYSVNKYISFVCGALQEEIKQRKEEIENLNNTIIGLVERIKDLEDKLNK